MKPYKTYHFEIPLHIYPFKVLFSMGESDEVLLKKLKKYGEFHQEESDNLKLTGVGRCIMCFDYRLVIIRIDPLFSEKHETLGTINHEILHAVIYILDACGVKLEKGVSDEAFTYLMGYISAEIHKKIKL